MTCTSLHRILPVAAQPADLGRTVAIGRIRFPGLPAMAILGAAAPLSRPFL